MASFSFGAGNARKLAATPLYALGRLLTSIVPRTRDEWVFGCGAGIGDGALALWRLVARDARPAVWLTGSAREDADAAMLGIPTVRRSSLRGLWRTARARYVVVTHGFGDVNRYAVTGAVIAQLWHGIPLKRIGLDSPETLRVPRVLGPLSAPARRMLRVMFRGAAQRIRVLPAASHLVRGRLESAFGLADSRVPVTGEPRVDVLSQGSEEERVAAARRILDRVAGPVGTARLVLYAPTWRDGAADPAVPSPLEWERIVDVLDRHDAVLLVRSHPLGAGEYRPPRASERVRAVGSDLVADITPVLPALTALVTDYSSLVFDAALVGLPVLLLAPDVDDYGNRRGFYGSYADVAVDGWSAHWTDAADELDRVLGDPAEEAHRAASSARLSTRVHAFRDGRNAQRVYRAILAEIPTREGRR